MAAIKDFRPHPLVKAVEETLRQRAPAGVAVQVQPDAEILSLAERTDLPDLSLLAGFLGAQFDHAGATWWLLYLDSRLHKWLLVPKNDIVVYERLDDATAFAKRRDVLWVKADARLLQGSGSQTIEGLFLVGEFTRAGDFASAPAARGTGTAATGLLCEATTPNCYCFSARTR